MGATVQQGGGNVRLLRITGLLRKFEKIDCHAAPEECRAFLLHRCKEDKVEAGMENRRG